MHTPTQHHIRNTQTTLIIRQIAISLLSVPDASRNSLLVRSRRFERREMIVCFSHTHLMKCRIDDLLMTTEQLQEYTLFFTRITEKGNWCGCENRLRERKEKGVNRWWCRCRWCEKKPLRKCCDKTRVTRHHTTHIQSSKKDDDVK